MLEQSRMDLPFECFQMEALNVLTSLDSYHETKKRQIDRVFDVLIDNLPDDLKNEPINETLEKLIVLAMTKITEAIAEDPSAELEDDMTVMTEENRKIIEDSIEDYCDDKYEFEVLNSI